MGTAGAALAVAFKGFLAPSSVSPLSYLLCPFLFFLYSSLIPSAVISPHSPSTHCPRLHRNTLQYCPKLPSFNPTYPSSHCSSFLFPNSKTSWNNGLHVLFIIPLFHSFLYSLQLAFYSHSSIQIALTKPPHRAHHGVNPTGTSVSPLGLTSQQNWTQRHSLSPCLPSHPRLCILSSSFLAAAFVSFLFYSTYECVRLSSLSSGPFFLFFLPSLFSKI